MTTPFRRDCIMLSLSLFSFVLGLVWIFEGQPPKTSVEESLLWMFPPFACTILAIPILLVVAHRNEEYGRSEDLNPLSSFVASSLAGAAAWLMILQVTGNFLRFIFATVQPYDPDSEELDAGIISYVIAIAVAVIVLLLVSIVAWITCLPAYYSGLIWKSSWEISYTAQLETENCNLENEAALKDDAC